ncbi:MAG: hypothetical protein AB7S78_12550 [Candidatus Omnitrophota bacterium]
MTLFKFRQQIDKFFSLDRLTFRLPPESLNLCAGLEENLKRIIPSGEVLITGVSDLTADDRCLHFKGETRLPGEGMSCGVHWIFFTDTAGLQAAGLFRLKQQDAGKYKFSQNYPVLKGTIFDCFFVEDAGVYSVATAAYTDAALGVSVAAGTQFNGTLTQDPAEFPTIGYITQVIANELKSVQVSGDISGDVSAPQFNLQFQLPDINLRHFFNGKIDLKTTVSLQSRFGQIKGPEPDSPTTDYQSFTINLDVTAKLGAAGTPVQFLCQMDIGKRPTIQVQSHFAPLTLDLNSLQDWVGGNMGELIKGLPKTHQQSNLSVSLTGLNFCISVRPVSLLSVTFLLQAGGGGDLISGVISIGGIQGQLTLLNPFGKCQASSMLKADMTVGSSARTTLEAELTYWQSFSFAASLKEGSSLNVPGLIQDLLHVPYKGPALPAFDQLLFQAQDVNTAPAWRLLAGNNQGFTIPVGPKGIIVEFLSIEVGTMNDAKTLSGDVSGQFRFLSSQTFVSADLAGDFELNTTVDGTYPVPDIVKDIAGQSWPAPSWMDPISVNKPAVLIQKKADDFVFLLTCGVSYKQIKTNIALAVEKYAGSSGFIAGMLFQNVNMNKLFPVLPASLGNITVQNAGMVVSSVTAAQFDIKTLFPDAPIDTAGYGIQKGLLFFSEIDLDKTDFKKLANLLRGKKARQNADSVFLTRLLLDPSDNQYEMDLVLVQTFDIVPKVISIKNPNAVFKVSPQLWSIQFGIESGTLQISPSVVLGLSGSFEITSTGKTIANLQVDTNFPIPKTNVVLEDIFVQLQVDEAGFDFEVGGSIKLKTSSPKPEEISMMIAVMDGEAVSGFCGCYTSGDPAKGTSFTELITSFIKTDVSNDAAALFDNIRVKDFMIIVVVDTTIPATLVQKCKFQDQNPYSNGLYFRMHAVIFGVNFDVNLLKIDQAGITVNVDISPFTICGLSVSQTKFILDSAKVSVYITGGVSYTLYKVPLVRGAATLALKTDVFHFQIKFQIYKTIRVDINVYFSSSKIQVQFTGTIVIKGPFGITIRVGAGVDVLVQSDGHGHAYGWVELPVVGKVYFLNAKFLTLEDYGPALDGDGDDEYLEQLEKDFLAGTQQEFSQMSIQTLIEKATGAEPTFEIDMASVTAKIVKKYMNKPCADAAQAVLKIHSDIVVGPEHLARDLFCCEAQHYKGDEDIYDPKDIIPVVATVMPDKMNATTGAIILCAQLDYKDNPKGGAEILYNKGQLYPLEPDILNALQDKQAYGLPEKEAQQIIDDIKGGK